MANEVGPKSRFFEQSDPLRLYIRVFEAHVSRPLIALQASMLSPNSFLEDLFAHNKSLSAVISKVREIEGFSILRSSVFVQDLVGPEGVLLWKASQSFCDHDIASYAGPGSGLGSNFVYRSNRNCNPRGQRKDQEAQWVAEQRDLLRTWKKWGLSEILLGSRRRELDLFMIEFSLGDYERAVQNHPGDLAS